MLWTLDSLRGHSQALPDDHRASQREHPLSSFFWGVDIMLYVAAVGFAACIIALLTG